MGLYRHPAKVKMQRQLSCTCRQGTCFPDAAAQMAACSAASPLAAGPDSLSQVLCSWQVGQSCLQQPALACSQLLRQHDPASGCSNDAANAAGPQAAIISLYNNGLDACDAVGTPVWVMAVAGAGIVLVSADLSQLSSHQLAGDLRLAFLQGLATFGHRVMKVSLQLKLNN